MIGDGDLESIFENGDFDSSVDIWNEAFTDRIAADLNGWFTQATQQTNLLTNEIETVNPKLDMASSVVTTNSIVTRCVAVINSANYRIERIEVNGTGVTTLHLKTL
ncbi:MAG: hypothetical protein IPL32_19940 [Chloracidobacterium sp.]|nr:hypothetical protein [Chloracidobacterium sp.]